MDNMPAWDAPVNFSANLGNDIATIAPMAAVWHGAQNGVAIQYTPNLPANSGGGSDVSKFFHFAGDIAGGVGHLAVGATKFLASSTEQLVEAPFKFGSALGHDILDKMDTSSINSQTQQINDRLATLNQGFKAGRITANQYTAELKSIQDDSHQLVQRSNSLNNRIAGDNKNTIDQGINTAATVLTIMTAGFGKATSIALSKTGLAPVAEKTAADYLASTNANALLTNVERGITKLASDPEAFAKLSPDAQRTLQTATAEVVGNAGATMTSSQIARATAVNLALKYPLYYNALSTTGQQIYAELDNQKYGDAVRTVAFNALLLLSGGPIGQALKYGGKALSSVGSRAFGRSSFIDELSKGIGDGSPDGLYNAITNIKDPSKLVFFDTTGKPIKLPKDEISARVAKNYSTMEAVNLNAVKGKDPVAAAWRVLNGMSSYEGAAMSTFTHDEAVINNNNFFEAQRVIDTVGKANGLGQLTAGRVDARAMKQIVEQLTVGDTPEQTLQSWEQLRASSPTQAWANSETLDKQMQSIIRSHPNGDGLLDAIAGIKANFKVRGFPDAVARQLEKIGYIPIKPATIEAPFKEGSGTIGTKFAKGEDFFTKAVQPLPVLSSIGKMLTIAGLSPQASTDRVYQLFNRNVAENFSKLDFAKQFGAKPEISSDNMIKKLSNYAHAPTRGGFKAPGSTVALRPPITDLRQLTTKDVATALEISSKEARQVKQAVMDAFLQVPLKIRGLGDKVMDATYKLPLTARYARVQGAARFAWNPIFKVKLAAKTEVLTQLESHGQPLTISGMNRALGVIFPDKYEQIDEVRNILHNKSFFEKPGVMGTIGGEGVNDTSLVSANLTHALIPSQERAISALVQVQADKAGMSVEDFLNTFPDQTRDTIQAIAQYDRRSSFLHSPLARTLNFAFFPFRFELKVATFMARSLATTSPMTQFAVIRGLYNGSAFLKSPEGQAWYAQNADVIGLIKYFTPLSTISTVANLLGGNANQIGAYGELGGLPFGWIPQLLDAEGLTHFAQGTVDAKTGNPIPKYVPATDKGKLAVGIQDLISSLFTYPGATAGLPSKTSITRNIALSVTGASKKTDLQSQTVPLSPQTQQYAQHIQALTGNTPQTPPAPQDIPFNQPTNVPTQPSSLTQPIAKTGSSGTVKKKKSQFIPAALPGA